MKTFDTTNVQIKDMTLSKSWYLVSFGILHHFVFPYCLDKSTAWEMIHNEVDIDGQLIPVYGNWLVFHENAHKVYHRSMLHIWSKRDILKYERTVAHPELLRKTC